MPVHMYMSGWFSSRNSQIFGFFSLLSGLGIHRDAFLSVQRFKIAVFTCRCWTPDMAPKYNLLPQKISTRYPDPSLTVPSSRFQRQQNIWNKHISISILTPCMETTMVTCLDGHCYYICFDVVMKHGRLYFNCEMIFNDWIFWYNDWILIIPMTLGSFSHNSIFIRTVSG